MLENICSNFINTQSDIYTIVIWVIRAGLFSFFTFTPANILVAWFMGFQERAYKKYVALCNSTHNHDILDEDLWFKYHYQFKFALQMIFVTLVVLALSPLTAGLIGYLTKSGFVFGEFIQKWFFAYLVFAGILLVITICKIIKKGFGIITTILKYLIIITATLAALSIIGKVMFG